MLKISQKQNFYERLNETLGRYGYHFLLIKKIPEQLGFIAIYEHSSTGCTLYLMKEFNDYHLCFVCKEEVKGLDKIVDDISKILVGRDHKIIIRKQKFNPERLAYQTLQYIIRLCPTVKYKN